MQHRTDGTSGYFNDVPYFTPVETAVFYEAVRACRLHRLPAHLMIKPRSTTLFADADSELARALATAEASKKGKRGGGLTAALPEFKTHFSANQVLFKSAGGDYVTICEGCDTLGTELVTVDSSATHIWWLSTATINTVWTSLLLFLNGCSGGGCRFIVHNIDTLCSSSGGSNEFLLSLLLVGVASILHFYSGAEGRVGLLSSVSIEFTVLSTDRGLSVADGLHFFAENSLKLTVSRTRAENAEAVKDEVIGAASVVESTAAYWAETVCGEVVDAHELLCDGGSESAREGCFCAPVVLLTVPHLTSLRTSLVRQILDSYSSEPLRVQSDSAWVQAEFEKGTPLVFVCSARWLVGQMGMPQGDCLLRRLNVKAMVHAGYCEVGDSVEEELLRCMAALRSRGIRCDDTRLVQLDEASYVREDGAHSVHDSGVLLQECANALLLLFRRFVTPYSPTTRQPCTSLPRELFFSRRCWDYFLHLAHTLRLAGVLASDGAAANEAIELTVLGRFLSMRFRVGEGALVGDALTVTDGKAILWAFLFRQPISVARDVVKGSHTFHSWVDQAVEGFCRAYRLDFELQAEAPQRALVEQLALFGVRDSSVLNRVHFLLSSPSGARFPLKPHLLAAAPTVCRGWYEQAPLNAGLALEKKEVGVFCLPPQSAYCELEAVEKSPSLRVQCPLELSYPIVIAHSVLHISLHNACVFSETDDPSIVTPLPASVLESGAMVSLLNGAARRNAGFWLDGVMNEITLATSESTVLAPLTLRGRHLLPYCERELFTRKRPRTVNDAAKAAEAQEFTGTLPRTAAERSAVEELAELIRSIGREKAEKAVRGKKGFSFLEPSHELHPFYLFNLRL